MPVPLSLFDEIYQAHGHRCPMSTLGGRLGYAARASFPEKDVLTLMVLYYARTCAVDGIRMAISGLEEGENLFVDDRGEHRLLVFPKGSYRGIEVCLREETLERAAEFRRLCADIDRRLNSLSEEEREALVLEREGALDVFLDVLRTLPDGELLRINEIAVDYSSLPPGVPSFA